MPAAMLYTLIAGIALGAVLTVLAGAYLQHRAKRRQVLGRIPAYDSVMGGAPPIPPAHRDPGVRFRS